MGCFRRHLLLFPTPSDPVSFSRVFYKVGETPFGEPSTQSYISHAEGVRYIHCCWDLQGRRTAPARGAQRGESSNTVRLHCWMYCSRMRARLSMVRSRGLRPLAPPWLSQSSRSTRSDSSSRLCNLPDRSVATATAGKLQRRSRREREGRGYSGKAKQGGGEQRDTQGKATLVLQELMQVHPEQHGMRSLLLRTLPMASVQDSSARNGSKSRGL